MLKHGSTIGFLGAGQLARMTSHAAQSLGYKTLCWSGGGDASPTRHVAGDVIEKPFTDASALQQMLDRCDVITVETENIAIELLEKFVGKDILRPRSQAVRIAGDRRLEREFIAKTGLEQTSFRVVNTAEDLEAAYEALGDCVAKTAREGYDGKGQWRIRSKADCATCLSERGKHELVVEKFITFEREVSVLVARSATGETVVYDPAENIHRHHVLDASIVPARVQPDVLERIKHIGQTLAEELDYIGLLAVETFVTEDGQVLINELAPRPHNSGHHTINACVGSQFENHVRAITGLPLISPELLKPTVMVNLLSDQWSPSDPGILSAERTGSQKTAWHLYEKEWIKGRRKLGHVTFLADTQEDVLKDANQFRQWLGTHSPTH